MKVKYITLMALSSVSGLGLTSCSEGEDGKPGFCARFYKDFIAPIFGDEKEEPRAGMPPLSGVSVMNLQQCTVPIYATWFGQLRGTQQADIKAEVAGRIISQDYIDGSPCEQGEVLFHIDDETYKAVYDMAAADLEAAKSAVTQAEIAVEQAQQDVDRYNKLEKGSVPQKTIEDALHAKRRSEALLAAAKARVLQAEAALNNAKINLDRCCIRAPFTGYASSSTVSVGDYVAPGANVLTRMSAINPIRVDFMVTGKHVLDIVKQTSFTAGEDMAAPFSTFEVILEDGSTYTHKDANGNDVPILGKIKTMDSEVNASTGTVSFIGEIPNDELRLRSGASVQIKAKIGEEQNAFVVPKSAILSSMNHRFIYVIGKDNQPYGIDVILGPEAMLDMPNGDGKIVKMPMQVVTARPGVNAAGQPRATIEEILADIGYSNPLEAPVIVSGGQMAQIYATANMGMKMHGITQGFGIINPEGRAPYIYTPPVTTTPSVTAQSPTPAAQK
ncbi:MAG: efflux RND transporter periplasmic adaptor subunit [Akkermansiaceae bacterium]|nr:efflux RND transporter periplasmic adaptor subunit [Akkermansiaceae bacterium]